MKFVHIADVHFDAPFVTLADNNDFGKLRRIEQREVFRKVIEYIKENAIPYFFIAGDLYEHNSIRQSTIEYINNLFKSIPNTKIFVSPGNHDPFLKNSFYNNFIWSDNVTIFTSKLEKVELEDVNIYGFGFDDFYSSRVDIDTIKLDDKEKLNILIIHGTIDGSDSAERIYNPIAKRALEDISFDYVALGHIHKRSYFGANEQIVYPGSTISLGFDEQGTHGMIVGDLEKNELNLDFIELDPKSFKEEDFDISEINSEEELIEKINALELDKNCFYKINLVGARKFEVNINQVRKMLLKDNILKLKNRTKLDINIEELSKETTLAGMFAREIIKEMNIGNYEKEYLNDILEIGMQILDK